MLAYKWTTSKVSRHRDHAMAVWWYKYDTAPIYTATSLLTTYLAHKTTVAGSLSSAWIFLSLLYLHSWALLLSDRKLVLVDIWLVIIWRCYCQHYTLSVPGCHIWNPLTPTNLHASRGWGPLTQVIYPKFPSFPHLQFWVIKLKIERAWEQGWV